MNSKTRVEVVTREGYWVGEAELKDKDGLWLVRVLIYDDETMQDLDENTLEEGDLVVRIKNKEKY